MRITTAISTTSSRTLACQSKCLPVSTTLTGMEQSLDVCVSILFVDLSMFKIIIFRTPAKDNVSMKAYALTNQNDQVNSLYSSFLEPTTLDGTQPIEYIDSKLFTKGFLVPLVLIITTIVVILVVIVAVCKLHSGKFDIASV